MSHQLKNFLFTNLITGWGETYEKFCRMQGQDGGVSNKAPIWAWKVTYRAMSGIPDGVRFLTKCFENNPEFKVAKLHQDILLSYFGNAAKGELEAVNWNPKIVIEKDKKEPLVALSELTDIDILFSMVDGNTGNTIDMGKWLIHYLENYGLESAFFRRIMQLMHKNDIAFPKTFTDANDTLIKKLAKIANIDLETRKVLDPNAPAPTKPVEVSPAAEKKDEPPEQNTPVSSAAKSDPVPLEKRPLSVAERIQLDSWLIRGTEFAPVMNGVTHTRATFFGCCETWSRMADDGNFTAQSLLDQMKRAAHTTLAAQFAHVVPEGDIAVTGLDPTIDPALFSNTPLAQ